MQEEDVKALTSEARKLSLIFSTNNELKFIKGTSSTRGVLNLISGGQRLVMIEDDTLKENLRLLFDCNPDDRHLGSRTTLKAIDHFLERHEYLQGFRVGFMVKQIDLVARMDRMRLRAIDEIKQEITEIAKLRGTFTSKCWIATDIVFTGVYLNITLTVGVQASHLADLQLQNLSVEGDVRNAPQFSHSCSYSFNIFDRS